LLQNNSRYLLVVAPKKADLVLPSEQALAAVLTQVQSQTLTPYVDKVADAKLLPSIPAPAAIVSETSDAKVGTTTIKLANGVQVVMKPTDFKADEVRFNAVSPGGSSLVSDADFPEAAHISQIVDNSGVGDFDQNALTRLLAGKVVSVSPYIGELNEGLRGSASTKDLETLFQLIYLYVTKPRADESAFATFKDQMHTELENRSLSVDAAFSDAITQARFGDSLRYNPLTLAELDQFDLQRAMAIYKERFADASDFTFVFVGNFDVAALKTLAQTYLGNLPASNGHESWQDVKPNPPDGKIEKMVYKGEDEQSRSFLLFTGYISPTQRNRLVLTLLQDVLDIRLRNDLREERSGTYSPGVYGNIAEDPDKSYGFYVTFGSDPKRVDELIKATWSDIADVKRDGPHADEFAKVTEQARRTHESDLRENQYWLDALVDDALHPAKNDAELLSFSETLDSIKPADIQNAAQQYLPEDRYIKVIQLPVAYQPK
jgi:zinc protease